MGEGNPRRSGVLINRRATIRSELLRLDEMLAASKKLRLSKQHNVTQAGIDERCKSLVSRIETLKAELLLLEDA